MSEGEPKGWVRVYGEIHEDQIVGNRVGLLKLKEAIDAALREGHADPDCDADFDAVTHVEEKAPGDAEGSSNGWLGLLFGAIAIVWLLVLPVAGAVYLIGTML